MEEPILEVRHISKAFPGVKALEDVSFTVRKGHVSVLVGENGAGKSTLIKIINGMYEADEGELLLDGQVVDTHTPRHMMDLGVATIHQELSPVPELSIAENIFLGQEKMFVDWKAMYRKADELIGSLGFHYRSSAKMRTLSTSGMQIIEIIKAVSKNARLVIMDEPTSSITESEVECLFEQIRRLTAQGIGVIYITHKLDEIFRIGDEATILRDGRVVSAFIGQALAGQPLTLFGDGSQTRSFCYVSDLIEGVCRLARSDFHEPVNLGDPGGMTIRQCAEEILRLSGSLSKIEARPLPVDDPKVRQPGIARARKVLGWEPKVPFEQGIATTIDSFRPRV